jgi:hypothetical protein
MTLVGWVDADRLDLGRGVQFYRGRPELPTVGRQRFQLTPLEPKSLANQPLLEAGAAACLLHPQPSLARILTDRGHERVGGATIDLAWLAHAGARRSRGLCRDLEPDVLRGRDGVSAHPCLRQLRLLRTLPISLIGLTGALMAIMLVPLIALGAASAAVAAVALGTPAALTFLTSYTFELVPASLATFLAVWLGDGKPCYAVLIGVLFGSQQVQLRLQAYLTRAVLSTCRHAKSNFLSVSPIIGSSLE